MRWLIAILFLLTGCKSVPLDFGGDSQKAFEWRWSWQQSKPAAQPSDEKPPFEVPPEVEATYTFPDVHAGMNYVMGGPDRRLTPTVGIEVCEFKVPALRWFNVQVQGGNQLADVYIGKRWTSVVEVTTGAWFGYDFEEHDTTWGLGATLIKF
jgi:hypothetical protein